jgi:transposase
MEPRSSTGSGQPSALRRCPLDVGFTPGAGLDGQKKTVRAWRVTPAPTGQQAEGIIELKAFGTLTGELLALSDGRAEAGGPQVAMESPGAYWRPVSTLLEGPVAVLLGHAAHVQQVPGRKTDKAEARWRAKRRRDGLLQASCMPPHPSGICAT